MKFRYKVQNFLEDTGYKLEMLLLGIVLKVLPVSVFQCRVKRRELRRARAG